ncbi:hypothetical protein D3C76_1186950 [compost metagenome]
MTPGFAEPFAVGFESASGQNAGLGLDTLGGKTLTIDLTFTDVRRDELSTLQLNVSDLCVVADLDAQLLGAAEVGINQRFAAAHEKRIGARNM